MVLVGETGMCSLSIEDIGSFENDLQGWGFDIGTLCEH